MSLSTMSLVMDDPGSPSHRLCSALRVSTKSKAPPPPSPPLKSLDPQSFPGFPRLAMDHKEDPLDKDLSLVVVLPGGAENITTVHGSKPLMDLLVTLCAKYHLNPSGHTLELVTANRNHIKFKPNALIGTLEAERVLLKAKGSEDKNKKAVPHMPEATVRMVINYRRTQKTILRVNPRVPLVELLPAICEKCEFQVETTVLLRDVQSQGPLDLDHSLNDYAIREVYARDTKGSMDPFCLSASTPPSPSYSGTVTPGKDKTQKEKENKGLFSMFRRTSKKKSEQPVTASAPASPVLVSKPRPLSMALPSSTATSSPFADVPKKRRAPQPPLLVSQSCPSDLGVRRRLHSEPTDGRVDREQMSGLSRGSSTESSLKRTKRKAPPPPTTPPPPPAAQDDTSLDGSSQGGSANNNNTTLEEIMEQEESTASANSAAFGDAQGDDRSLNLSGDVSLDARSLDAGRDQLGDLSSDGKSVQRAMDDSAVHGNTVTSVESSEMTVTERDQVREAKQESTTESAAWRTPPASPVRPDTREAGAQVSVPANTESPKEASGSENSAADIAPRPAGEDAQVQTDFTPPQVEVALSPPSSSSSRSLVSGSGSPGTKRDMATLTEEQPNPSEPEPAASRAFDTPSLRASMPQSAPASAKAASVYATDSEPKPKPSNELTRDYIPKEGMTTYTIVPPKTLDKLRYFEVELTLEAPPAAPPGEEVDIVSLQPEDGASREEKPGEVGTEPQTATPREDALMSADTTVSESLSEPTCPPSAATGSPTADDEFPSHPSDGGLQGGPAAKVKEVKIPPATKPKPGSFRLPQHKRTPGYYVTSAAVKSLGASPSTGQKEAPASPEEARLLLPPPPPPPPTHCQGEPAGAGVVKPSQEDGDERSLPVPPVTRQSSLPSKEPALGLSLAKLRSFAAPRPFSPSTPSRFAQAVSSAVKRTQSLSHGPKSPTSPVSPTFSPIAGRFSIKESKGLPKSKEGHNRQVDGDKGLDGAQDGPLSRGGIVHVGGGEDPQQCPDPKNTSTQISTEEPVSLPEPISP